MKKFFPILTALCLCSQLAFAQSGGGGIGPSQIKRPPLVPPQPKRAPQPPIPAPVYQPPAKPSSAVSPTYTEPGILSYKQGQWVGTDHLYNIGYNIPIVIDFVVSDKLTLNLSKESLQKRAEAAFIKEGIQVEVQSTGRPPLPFFNIVILVIPLGEEGVTASCSGRLFEIVDNKRSNLEDGVYWQAITWEEQQLTVSSVEQAPTEIINTQDIIVNTFLERYNYFQKINRRS